MSRPGPHWTIRREAEAVGRGLDGIRLDGVRPDTWTFQAPGFHRRLGYRAFGRIDDDPPGHARVFFVKRFGDPASGGTSSAAT